MSTFTKTISANFGSGYTGLAGSVGYTVKDASGTTLVSRTTSGVTESVALSGAYQASVDSWDSSWKGFILWDITGQAGVAAVEDFDSYIDFSEVLQPLESDVLAVKERTDNLPDNPASAGGEVTLDLNQLIPTSNTPHTLGDALNAARAQGFGKWVIEGTALTLYAADGTTPVRVFTLNSASRPTSRI